jgi:hypothetical protein
MVTPDASSVMLVVAPTLSVMLWPASIVIVPIVASTPMLPLLTVSV